MFYKAACVIRKVLYKSNLNEPNSFEKSI